MTLEQQVHALEVKVTKMNARLMKLEGPPACEHVFHAVFDRPGDPFSGAHVECFKCGYRGTPQGE